MLNCAHELQEKRAAAAAALRRNVEESRAQALSIQERIPNARAVDGYTWLLFEEGSRVYLASMDGHRWRLNLDVYGHIINDRDFAPERLAQLQAVIDAYSAEN